MTVGAILLSILLAIVASELFDVMPWLAKKALRLAARIDARSPGEAEKLFAEWNEGTDALPGKVTKVVYALGWLFGVALARRVEQFARVCRQKALALGKRAIATVSDLWPRKASGVFQVVLVVLAFGGSAALVAWALSAAGPSAAVVGEAVAPVASTVLAVLSAAVAMITTLSAHQQAMNAPQRIRQLAMESLVRKKILTAGVRMEARLSIQVVRADE